MAPASTTDPVRVLSGRAGSAEIEVWRLADACQVYVIVDVATSTATAVDAGTGLAFAEGAVPGVRVTDVVITHHHRDQTQGLATARAGGVRIWVPPVEHDLIADVDAHWQARDLVNSYNLRQDRFSLLTSVPVDGDVAEYRIRSYGSVDLLTLPTPGHTPGSVSYALHLDDGLIAFTGDLLYAPGKIWSAAALQWTYTGLEGAEMTIASLCELLEHQPSLMLPSHGDLIDDPPVAAAATIANLQRLANTNRPAPQDAGQRWRHPFVELSPHLLRNTTANAISYAVLSDAGTALLLDFGYDFTTGWPAGQDRAARRPWLPSLRALSRDYGIDRVEVAIPTHYHDDHVAGMPLLREVCGTQIWAGAAVADVLRRPAWYDLPCLWYEPIPVDRDLHEGVPVRWREYEITTFPLPGHTLYADAIHLVVDGRTVVATGDQQDGGWEPGLKAETLNFQYANGFRYDDFVRSAELYQRLQPDLMISGHWAERTVTPDYLEELHRRGTELAEIHRDLLPLSDLDTGTGGEVARMHPYRSARHAGASLDLTVDVRNPYPHAVVAKLRAAVPAGWAPGPPVELRLAAHQHAEAHLCVGVGETPGRRWRVGVDLTFDGRPWGQVAECLVDVRPD